MGTVFSQIDKLTMDSYNHFLSEAASVKPGDMVYQDDFGRIAIPDKCVLDEIAVGDRVSFGTLVRQERDGRCIVSLHNPVPYGHTGQAEYATLIHGNSYHA